MKKTNWLLKFSTIILLSILLLSAIYLGIHLISSYNYGFINQNSEITGCREMGNIIIFKYIDYYATFVGLISPIFFIPWILQKPKKVIIFMLVILPFFSWLTTNLATHASFRYRGELRERYGKEQNGYLAVDRLMPSDIRKEYAKGCRNKQRIISIVIGWAYITIWNYILIALFSLGKFIIKVFPLKLSKKET